MQSFERYLSYLDQTLSSAFVGLILSRSIVSRFLAKSFACGIHHAGRLPASALFSSNYSDYYLESCHMERMCFAYVFSVDENLTNAECQERLTPRRETFRGLLYYDLIRKFVSKSRKPPTKTRSPIWIDYYVNFLCIIFESTSHWLFHYLFRAEEGNVHSFGLRPRTDSGTWWRRSATVPPRLLGWASYRHSSLLTEG